MRQPLRVYLCLLFYFCLHFQVTSTSTSSSSSSSSGIDLSLAFTNLSPEKVVAYKNKPLLLNCSGSSGTQYGPLRISWKHQWINIKQDENKQIFKNGSLSIRRFAAPKKKPKNIASSKRSDEGLYTCLLHNDVGTIISRPIHVIASRLPQSFDIEPQPQFVSIGSSMRFQCQIRSQIPTTYIWLFNGHQLPQIAQYNQRYIQLSNGILQILNVSSSDEGNFKCVAKFNETDEENYEPKSLTSKEAKLTVTHESSPDLSLQFLSKSTHIIGKTKESVMIECLLSNSNAFVNWFKKSGKPFVTSERIRILGSNLVIEDLRIEDDDTYICNSSINGDIGTQENILTVQMAPEFRSKPQNKVKPAAQTARFHCSADGIPNPTITWFKNGEPLDINGRIKMKNEKNNSLVISQLVINDSGLYQCFAENSAGISIASARLIVNASNSQPDPPKEIKAKTVSSTSILLSWNPSNSPSGLTIQAYTVHYMPTSGGVEMQKVAINTTQLIDKLEPFTNYTFYVRAYNGRSASEQSKSMICITDEDVPIGIPKVNLIALSPTVLNVSWEELPPKIARGIIVGHRIHYRKHNQASYNVEEFPSHIKHCTIEGLMPLQNYDVRVMCRTKAGYPSLSDNEWQWNTFQMPKEINHEAYNVPGPPTLYLVPMSNSIEVKWEYDNNTNIDGFKLYYQIENHKTFIGPTLLKPDIRKHTLKNLKLNQTYKVHLFAYNTSGDGILAVQNVSLADKSIDKAIKAPHSLEAEPVSSTSIRLTWKIENFKNIVYYTIRYNSMNLIRINESVGYNYTRSSKNEAIINGLLPFTTYEFSVKGHDIKNNYGPYSSKIECKTLEDIPSSPQELAGAIVHNNTARLTWTQPSVLNGVIKNYIVLYNTKYHENFDSWEQKIENGTKFITLIYNLSSNTQYFFCVKAETKAGFGPPSSCISLTTPLLPGQTIPLVAPDPILGVILGLGIGLLSIVICIIIIICRNKCSTDNNCANGHSVHYQNGFLPSMYGDSSHSNDKHLSSSGELKEMESFISPRALMGHSGDNFLDTKGGNSPTRRNGYLNNGNGIHRFNSNDSMRNASPLLESEIDRRTSFRESKSESFSVPFKKHQKIVTNHSTEMNTSTENCASERTDDSI